MINVTKPDAIIKLPPGTVNNEEASVIVNLMDLDSGVSSPPKKVKNIDSERVIMGEELGDVEFNFAQQSVSQDKRLVLHIASRAY